MGLFCLPNKPCAEMTVADYIEVAQQNLQMYEQHPNSPHLLLFAASYLKDAEAVATGGLGRSKVSKDVKGNYTTGDSELDLLLGLTEDMAVGQANMDTGMWWYTTLESIKARLAPVQPIVVANGGVVTSTAIPNEKS